MGGVLRPDLTRHVGSNSATRQLYRLHIWKGHDKLTQMSTFLTPFHITDPAWQPTAAHLTPCGEHLASEGAARMRQLNSTFWVIYRREAGRSGILLYVLAIHRKYFKNSNSCTYLL
jgi:hypothetical protein